MPSLNQWIEEFEHENVRLRNENGALWSDNAALRAENTKLKARIQTLEQAPKSERQAHSSRGRELGGVIDALLPGILLLRDSPEVIEHKLENFEPVLHELRLLCYEPAAIRGERVQGAPGWRERHFHTGQKDDGRFYFRRRDDATWMVLVSFKQCQERDIEYLRRC